MIYCIFDLVCNWRQQIKTAVWMISSDVQRDAMLPQRLLAGKMTFIKTTRVSVPSRLQLNFFIESVSPFFIWLLNRWNHKASDIKKFPSRADIFGSNFLSSPQSKTGTVDLEEILWNPSVGKPDLIKDDISSKDLWDKEIHCRVYAVAMDTYGRDTALAFFLLLFYFVWTLRTLTTTFITEINTK